MSGRAWIRFLVCARACISATLASASASDSSTASHSDRSLVFTLYVSMGLNVNRELNPDRNCNQSRPATAKEVQKLVPKSAREEIGSQNIQFKTLVEPSRQSRKKLWPLKVINARTATMKHLMLRIPWRDAETAGNLVLRPSSLAHFLQSCFYRQEQ